MINLIFVGRFNYVVFVRAIIGGGSCWYCLFYVDLCFLGLAELRAMGATAWAMAAYNLPLVLMLCVVIYLLVLILLRTLTPEEQEMQSPLMPVLLCYASWHWFNTNVSPFFSAVLPF